MRNACLFLGFGLFCLFGVVGNAVAAPASTGFSPPAVLTGSLTPSVVSQYMFRGMRYGGTAFQPTAELSYGSVVGGFWGSIPMRNKVRGVSDPELDLYASASLPVTAAIAVVPGFTWYHFPDAVRSAGFHRQLFEPSLALTYTGPGFRLTPKLYYDVVREGLTAEFSAFYALPLTRFGTELDFTATVGSYLWRDAVKTSAAGTKNWGDYGSAGVALPFQVSSAGRVTLGLAYVKGTNNYFKSGAAAKVRNPAAVGRGVVSLFYTHEF